MTEENVEYNMAEDLLRDLEGLVDSLEWYKKKADGNVTLQVPVTKGACGRLLRQARRARKIAQVYYDRVK